MFAGSEKVATFASAFETKRPVLSKTALLALRAILRMKCRRFRSNAKFLKKSCKKFWSFKNLLYLCNRVWEKRKRFFDRSRVCDKRTPDERCRKLDRRKVLEKKSCRKVCKFKKLALPLQSRSRHKRRTVFKLVLWFTGKFWEKRNVVFICQFFKREAK